MGALQCHLVKPAEKHVKAQLPALRTYADLWADPTGEIAAQANDLTSFFGSIAYLDNDRHKFTMEVIYAVLRTCIVTETEGLTSKNFEEWKNHFHKARAEWT